MTDRLIIPKRRKTHVPAADDAMQERGPKQAPQEREIVKIMLRAAIAALSLGTIGSAYADSGDTIANTRLTETKRRPRRER
jgi:hypothetical protein